MLKTTEEMIFGKCNFSKILYKKKKKKSIKTNEQKLVCFERKVIDLKSQTYWTPFHRKTESVKLWVGIFCYLVLYLILYLKWYCDIDLHFRALGTAWIVLNQSAFALNFSHKHNCISIYLSCRGILSPIFGIIVYLSIYLSWYLVTN